VCDEVDEYTARRQAEADGLHEERLVEAAVREEREAVVQWLRATAAYLSSIDVDSIYRVALGIEAGEHRKP